MERLGHRHQALRLLKVVIACEYQATASKADEVIVIRPGTDAALALGFAT